MEKITAFALVMTLLFSVCPCCSYADERFPLGVYDMTGKLLFKLGDSAADVMRGFGYENYKDYIQAPYVVYDEGQIELPEIEEPTEDAYSVYYDPLHALASAVPDPTGKLTVETATTVLAEYGLSIYDLPTMTNNWYKASDIEEGRLTYKALQRLAEFAESYRSIYQSALEIYQRKLDTPYEQWKKDVGSSLTVSSGMLSLMVRSGGAFYGTMDLNGARLSFDIDAEIDQSFMNHDMVDVGFERYLDERLDETTYATIEERNAAIEAVVQEYQTVFKDYYVNMVEHSTLKWISIDKLGYMTGEGYFVGKEMEKTEDRYGYIVSYYVGNIPLSNEYVETLSEKEKGEINLSYIQMRLDEKNYISQIFVGKYQPVQKKEPTTEEAFVADLLAGYTERDAVVKKYKQVFDSLSEIKQVEVYEAYLAAEKEHLDKYRDAEFSDAGIAEGAKAYFKGLDAQYEAVTKYMGRDQETFDALWTQGYYDRCKGLYFLSQVQKLTVAYSLQSTLNEMIEIGEVFGMGQAVEDDLTQQIKTAWLQDSYKSAEIVIGPFELVNHAGFSIKQISITTNTLDEAGNIVESKTVEKSDYQQNETLTTSDALFSLPFKSISFTGHYIVSSKKYTVEFDFTVQPDVQWNWNGDET